MSQSASCTTSVSRTASQVDLLRVLVVLDLGAHDRAGDQRRRVFGHDVPADAAALLAAPDDVGEEIPHAAQDALELRGELRIGVERLDHQRDDEAAVVRDGGVEEAGVDDALQ